MRRAPEDESPRVALGPPPADEDLALLVLSGPARGRYYKVPRRGGVVGGTAQSSLRPSPPRKTDGCSLEETSLSPGRHR